MSGQVYTVSQVNNHIKNLLDGDPALSGLYVRGEISNYRLYPSGHHYFTLKDAEGVLRCVFFRGSAVGLKFRPENGMTVIARGRVSVFPRDGQYQLYVAELIPEGAGELYVAFEQLKRRLGAEGLFAPEHKRPLPRYPQRILLVTSPAGAAVRDMLRILNHRWPLARVLLLPVRVQGTEAPGEIAGAIRYANQRRLGDLLITGRGGGSIEDLWAFNEEIVARAIYESSIPVISAVGHEPDVTIADFVADLRAATPSNAAELAVPDQTEVLAALQGASARLTTAVTRRLGAARQQVESYEKKRVLTDPMAYVQDRRMRLDFTHQRLGALALQLLGRSRERFVRLTAGLDAMSPLKVLARGYAIAQDEEGRVLKDAGAVRPGERVQVKLEQGCFRAEVLETERK